MRLLLESSFLLKQESRADYAIFVFGLPVQLTPVCVGYIKIKDKRGNVCGLVFFFGAFVPPLSSLWLKPSNRNGRNETAAFPASLSRSLKAPPNMM